MTKTEKWEWENNKKGDGVGDCEEREWIWVHVKFERKGIGHEKRTVIMIIMIAIRNASLVSTLSITVFSVATNLCIEIVISNVHKRYEKQLLNGSLSSQPLCYMCVQTTSSEDQWGNLKLKKIC